MIMHAREALKDRIQLKKTEDAVSLQPIFFALQHPTSNFVTLFCITHTET